MVSVHNKIPSTDYQFSTDVISVNNKIPSTDYHFSTDVVSVHNKIPSTYYHLNHIDLIVIECPMFRWC